MKQDRSMSPGIIARRPLWKTDDRIPGYIAPVSESRNGIITWFMTENFSQQQFTISYLGLSSHGVRQFPGFEKAQTIRELSLKPAGAPFHGRIMSLSGRAKDMMLRFRSEGD